MAPNDQRDQWDTLTNPMGNKLHILSPTQYTFEEHKWLQKRHNNRSKLDIIPKEASAPKDRRTAVIEWLDHTLYCNPKLKQKMDAPLDYQLEMQRLHVASKLAELRSGPPQDTLEGTMPEPELQVGSLICR